MRRGCTLLLYGAVLATIASCSGAPPGDAAAGSPHRVEHTVEDGVPMLVNYGGPKFAGEIFRYEMVTELDAADNPDAILHFAETFTMDDDGYFYVADTRRHRVAVFDPQGGYVRSIGQEGDGPGDLRGPFDVEIVDGTLQVLGSRGFRLTVFDLDGSLLDVVQHAGETRPRAMYRTHDGIRVVMTAPFERGTEFQGHRARAEILTPDGEATARIETDWVRTALMVDVAGLRYISPIQYAARPQVLYSPRLGSDGATKTAEGWQLLTTSGLEPLLSWYGPDGRLLRRVRLDLEPQSVADAERRAVAADLDRRIVEAPEGSNERERILGKGELGVRRDNMVFEEPRAYWGFTYVDDRSTVWLQYSRPVSQEFYANNRYRFRVLDAEGVYIGDTTWPRIQGEGKVVRGHLLAMVFHEETLQLIPTVFRIAAAVADLTY